eukprot:4833443-Pleurochrysis_carterae.AAC.1
MSPPYQMRDSAALSGPAVRALAHRHRVLSLLPHGAQRVVRAQRVVAAAPSRPSAPDGHWRWSASCLRVLDCSDVHQRPVVAAACR